MANLSKLLAERILVCDGAMGTELMRRGAPSNTPGEMLNLDQPELVEAVHREYVEAGSDLTITNTFGATKIKLAKFGLADRAREINLAAVRLAKAAAGDRALVGGDLGPTGEMLKPWGPAEPATIRATYFEQVRALAEGGVDCLLLETFFDLNEALLALEAALSTGLPVIASMTFDAKRGSAYTMMGNSAADCARALDTAGAVVVGANCSVSIDHMPMIAAALKSGADVPLILQPNAGKPETLRGQTTYRETPEHFAALVPDLVRAGARIIGGCCGTDARFVRAIREALQKQ